MAVRSDTADASRGLRLCSPLPGQPVLLDLWQSSAPSKKEFTTVGNWKQDGHDIDYQGETYYWSKHHEFLKFIDLPRRVDQHIELATSLAYLEPEVLCTLNSNGWQLTDAQPLSSDPWLYRDYIRASPGEFSVAKDQNVPLLSGWCRCRCA